MDLGQIGFEKAQAMMLYLRAMLRNVEREIASNQESHKCDSITYNAVGDKSKSSNESLACNTSNKTADH